MTSILLAGPARRMKSLARAEALLLRRNPIALLNALLVPVAVVFFLQSVVPEAALQGGDAMVTSLAAISLLIVVYYNLVTTLVARREELVLKRLHGGECGDAEVLVGAAMPVVTIAWAQIVIGLVAGLMAFGMDIPASPVLVIVAVRTAMTRTVELAQVSTMPVLIVSLALSGLMFPLDILPEPVQWAAQLLPLTQVVDLLQLGLTGAIDGGANLGGGLFGSWGTFGAALPALVVLASWVTVGVLGWRRFMRWEPRR